MGKKKTKLREQAEKTLQEQQSDTREPSELSPGETHSLIHELRVHQIELEMQNDELRRTQLELEQVRDRYIDLYDFAPVGYFTISDKGMILEANLSGATMLGIERGLLKGKPFSRFISADTQDIFYLHRKELIGKKVPQSCELKLKRSDAAELWAQLECIIVQDGEGSFSRIRAAVTDITDRKQAEEEKANLEAQLHRAQKMEAVGTLAGGVAHDLNNVLGGIVGYPELLLMQLPEDSPLRKPLSIIRKSGERAAAIVQDLQTLTRSGFTSTEVVDLNRIISDHMKTPEFEKIRSIHPHMRFEIDLEEKLLNISGSPVHLSKTIMNLISNAAEAMPHGGKVLISTGNRYIDRPVVGYDEIAEGEYVTLSISDEGTGMSKEVADRIFEPFYTKKVMGRSGTGLGMTVVWGVVNDHKGYIDIRSTEEKGTTVTLYFPATRKELIKADAPLSVEEYMGKGESILIVDDVETQREIATGMLERLGYKVTSVSSGEGAIEYLKGNSADLLLLDMIMDPGIDGLETYKRILETHPKQKALIVSGYAETERVKEAQKLGAGAYIKKPFVFEQIGIAVRYELDE